MTPRRSKDIGTDGERAVLNVVRDFWPTARREVLHGHKDLGDIVGCDPVMFEVKAGKQARQFGDAQLAGWMAETEKERLQGGMRFGVLVTQREGFGLPRAAKWWAFVTAAALGDMLGAPGHDNSTPVRMELGLLLNLLADQGFTPDVDDGSE